MLIVGIVALCATLAAAILVAAACSNRSRCALLLGTFVLWQAQSAIVIQALSLLGAVRLGPVVIGSFLLAGILGGIVIGKLIAHPSKGKVIAALAIRRRGLVPPLNRIGTLDIVLALFVFALLLAKLFQLAQVHVLPLVVSDVTTYHAPRVLMWAQQGSIADFPSWEWRQNVLPKTGLAFQLQLYLTTGNLDHFEVVQWLASLVSIVAVYQIAIQLEASRRQALLAALASAALPIIYTQSITGQNDILVAAYALAFLALARMAIESRSLGLATLAALSLGLALGTKLVFLWIVPPVAAILVWSAWRARTPLRFMAFFGVICLISVFLLSSYTFIENYIEFGDALSGGAPPGATDGRWSVPRLGQVCLRYLYQLADPSGLPLGIADWLNGWRTEVFRPWMPFLSQALGIHPYEDLPFGFQPTPTFNHPVLAWYGLMGAVILVPVCFVSLLLPQAWRSGTAFYAAILPVMLLINALFLAYHNSLGRYFIVGFSVCCAILARYFPNGEGNATVRSWVLAFTVVGLSLPSLYFGIVNDQRKGGYLFDSEIRIVAVETDLALKIIMNDAIPPGQRIGLMRVTEPYLFMDPRRRNFIKFIAKPDGNYLPDPFQSIEAIDAYAQKEQLDYVIGSTEYFAGSLPSDQDAIVVAGEIFFYARNRWAGVHFEPNDIETLSKLKGTTLPVSMVARLPVQQGAPENR